MFIDPRRACKASSHSKYVQQDTLNDHARHHAFCLSGVGLFRVARPVDSHAYQPGDRRRGTCYPPISQTIGLELSWKRPPILEILRKMWQVSVGQLQM